MRQLATGKGYLVAKERDETADHPASSLNSSEKIGKQMKEEQLAIERRKMRQMATCSSGELQLPIASHLTAIKRTGIDIQYVVTWIFVF